MLLYSLAIPNYVITVGASLPVNSSSCTALIALSARLFSAVGAASPCLVVSFSYFSRYIRIVAPADPVPLRRKTTRAASPDLYSKLRISPCFDVVEPSTGSVYLKGEKATSVYLDSQFQQTIYLCFTYENSSAPTIFIPESSAFNFDKSPSTRSFLIRSIILLAASLSTAS